MTPFRIALAASALATLLPMSALAQPMMPPPANVVSLSASASVELPNDWLSIAFSTSRDGSDAAAVQAQLRQALDAALAEARKLAKPGQVEVQTGGFTLMPRYGNAPARSGVVSGPAIVGWMGTAELLVQGRDVAAITQLAGRVQTLTVARIGFSLSREAREKVEADVTAQAIARFRTRAEGVAKAFGMGSYTLREVAVSGDEGGQPVQRTLMRAQSAVVMSDGAQPAEAGKSLVTATVSGSVQIAK